MSLGTRVIQIRNQKGMTQRELSEHSGIAASYVSRIENRRLEPSPKTLRKIAAALGVPVSDLFQESPAASGKVQCFITASGSCVMDLVRASRGKPAHSGGESYTPRQLQLLRMSGYLVQSSDARILDTLEVFLEALLSAERRRGAAAQHARTEVAKAGLQPRE